MSFVLQTQRSVLWPIKVHSVRDDGSGEFDEHVVKLRFTLLDREELKAFYERELKGLVTPELSISERVKAAIRGKVASDEDMKLMLEKTSDWKDVISPEGKEVPFSKDAFRQALKTVAFFRAALEGLIEASQEVPRKNS